MLVHLFFHSREGYKFGKIEDVSNEWQKEKAVVIQVKVLIY